MMEKEIDSNNIEEPEGLDDGSELEGNYPIDEFLIRTDYLAVSKIVERMDREHSPYIKPDFQRSFLWDEHKQSRLIESALLRIPLPVFYFAERDDGTIAIVDGLQRLSTFQRYLNGKFKLQGVNNSILEGKFFKDLPPRLADRLEDTTLTIYIIDKQAPDQARLDIFERVNSGVPLSRQQMRNAIHDGPATRWLRAQAEGECFLRVTTGSLSQKTMRDREFVNRFCGFQLLGYKNYVSQYGADMDKFLADTLRQMNKMSDAELEKLKAKFEQSMETNWLLFENYAFRRHKKKDRLRRNRRSVINAALFDVWSVVLTSYSTPMPTRKQNAIRSAFYSLLDDAEFEDTIRISTNSSRKVKTRFELVYKKLEAI